MSLADGISIVDAGIDYITVTANEEKTAVPLGLLADRLQRKERKQGFDVHTWGFSGYKGWQCGEAQFGIRHDGAIVRLSSGLAHDFWRQAYEHSNHVSRVDYQVTVKGKISAPALVQKQFRRMRKWFLACEGRPEPKCIVGPHGAETINSGARTSDVYGRMYDKGKESQQVEYQDCARCECEFKGPLAGVAALAAFNEEDPLPTIVGGVRHFFVARGGALELSYKACAFQRPLRTSDDEKRLRWVRNAVGGTAMLWYERNRMDEFLAALGFELVDGALVPKR